jgi:hypothetical protein
MYRKSERTLKSPLKIFPLIFTILALYIDNRNINLKKNKNMNPKHLDNLGKFLVWGTVVIIYLLLVKG